MEELLLYMIISVVCIGLSFWALQSVKFDLFLSNAHGPAVKVLQIFLSIAIGHSVARFFVDYVEWTRLFFYSW